MCIFYTILKYVSSLYIVLWQKKISGSMNTMYSAVCDAEYHPISPFTVCSGCAFTPYYSLNDEMHSGSALG